MNRRESITAEQADRIKEGLEALASQGQPQRVQVPTGYVRNPSSPNYGQPCKRHERDRFDPTHCVHCGTRMRPPAMRG